MSGEIYERKVAEAVKAWGLDELPDWGDERVHGCAPTVGILKPSWETGFEFARKNTRASVSIRLGTVNGLWSYGIDLKGHNWGHGFAPSILTGPFPTREKALREGIEYCIRDLNQKRHEPLRPEEKAVLRELQEQLKPKQGELFA